MKKLLALILLQTYILLIQCLDQKLTANNGLQMVLEPNGNKWKILKYQCRDSGDCQKNCQDGNVSRIGYQVNSCTYTCDCSIDKLNYILNTLPSSCKMVEVKTCREIKFRRMIRKFCYKRIQKQCKNISL